MIKIKNLLLLVLFCSLSSSLFAQKGARISGTITSDAEGPLIMVNITERDKSDRIISHSSTDFEGNFSMVVKSTANELEITYIGYKTQRLPIGSRTVFNVKMVEDNVLDQVEIVAKAVQRSGGLDILEREMTHATQKISMDDMEGLSFTSVDQALQGQIAGLDVVFNSGDVGSGTQMRLRGNSVLDDTAGGSGTPLIVVDDNILTVDLSSLNLETATEETFADLLMVNTEDIAEIEVLKDAASCAVYGSQGANGVIKIKTRRGKRGPTRVNFSYKFKDKWTPNGINLLNGDDYTMLIKQALFNKDQSAVVVPELNYDKTFPEYENYNNNTDWVNAVSKHGYSNDYNLNLSGGGEKAAFRISGGYSNETGQVIGQYLQRFTSRLALDYYVSQRIKVIADFSFTYTTQRRNTDDLLSMAQKMMPNMSIYKQDIYGNNTDDYYAMLNYGEGANTLQSSLNGQKNPIAVGDIAQYHTENYNISPQITFEYNLLGLEDNETQLKYRGMVNLSAATSAGTVYTPSALSMGNWDADAKNNSQSNDGKSLYFTTRHQFIFTPYLGSSDHYLTMNGQFELRTGSGNSQNSTAVGLPTGNISSTTVGSKLSGASSSKWENRNISFAWDAHYSYKSKYALRLAIRDEGLTTLGDDRRWAAYPSVSARWNIIDEDWMEWARKYVSMLSIRPGWGLNGSAPSENKTYNSYSSYNNLAYLGMAAFQMDGIRLTDLRSQRTNEWNIGSDFGFFGGKLSGAFNYYNRTTKDQLVSSYTIPSPTGYSSLAYKNSGSMRNQGWELNFSLNNMKLAQDFSVSFNFNVGKNYNEILELEEAYLEKRNGKYDAPANETYLSRVQIGNPGGSIYGFRYKGVYRYSYKNWEKALSEEAAGRNGTCPIVRDSEGNVVFNADGTPKKIALFFDNEELTTFGGYEFRGGDAIYEDVNHDGTINQLDIVYLGNSNPKAQGGFGLTFRYKKWTLRTNFTYRYDVDVVNSARMAYENMATFNNQSKAVNWRWRKEGDITEIPRAMYGSSNSYNYLGSDRYVEDASYIRLSYVQLSYSFEPEWIKKMGLKSLNLYASADNVCFWTKYTGLDPEVAAGGGGIAYDGSKTPRSRSYTVSLSVGF